MNVRLLLTPLLAAGLVACSSASGTEGEECRDWPAYATPEEALEQADYVITADIVKRVGNETVFDTEAHAYSVSTKGLPVLKGDDLGHTDLKVISTPQQCSGGDAYPDGDPLSEKQRVILFLTREGSEGLWRTITPEHGVLPASGSDTLPENWPA
ncbi:hypothetical protein [Streptomyces phaeochromogenes]|uniref:hypothetical protein n=1 Tax=Streptomyces phaeochromogenes TaxID=1923 RepID=UPI00386F6704|nr:hypothetical protein OG277_15910 [Streptomyces phaeochromogenes]